MDWTPEKIVSVIENVRKDSLYLTEKDIQIKYKEFMEKFPKLYYSCMTPDFNMNTLNMMLNYRTKAETENIPDMVRDVTIGESIAKKYLYPVVGEPTIDQKKKAARKVAEKYYTNDANNLAATEAVEAAKNNN
jgi:hypothetical protein